jgi:hypothetical protein
MATTIQNSGAVRTPERTSVTARLEGAQTKGAKWSEIAVTVGVSTFLHAIVLFLCAMIVFDNRQLEEIFTTIASINEVEPEPITETSLIQPEEIIQTNVDPNQSESNALDVADVPVDMPNINDLDPSMVLDSVEADSGLNIKIGDAMAGRSAAAKSQLLKEQGGNDASEAAVLTGLKWLANHQADDGSWNFNHVGTKGCDCSQPGTLKACKTGATAMAMLAYMGGGHTHKKGDYQKEMKGAVDFMIKSQKVTPEGGDFRGIVSSNEGFYTQGLVTIALCEALALTKDERLRTPAFNAVKFIVNAQNPKDGGWRYQPRQAGDTSVVGWQVMALKSAQMSKIKVPPQTFRGAEKFLDACAKNGGSQYTYVPGTGDAKNSMTAAGLLCRIYMGWEPNKPALKEGVAHLDKAKPAKGDMYYNYYATQVMHHWGGPEWQRWNAVMRDQLIKTQLKQGHATGSWNVADPHGGSGGRLYMTCLAVMTLEVYYRHLPIYQRENVKVDF